MPQTVPTTTFGGLLGAEDPNGKSTERRQRYLPSADSDMENFPTQTFLEAAIVGENS